MNKLKALIIDDSAYRKDITEIIENTELSEVVRAFSDAIIALDWLKYNTVQVIFFNPLLNPGDIPHILKSIKEINPAIAVILISDGTTLSTELTLVGLRKGALDFIKIAALSPAHKEGLKNHLKVLFSQTMIKINSVKTQEQVPLKARSVLADVSATDNKTKTKRLLFDPSRWNNARLILIAASTGGPVALEKICSYLPGFLDIPILIVQHIPAEFTAVMVDSLRKKCPIPLSEGQDKDIISPQHIYIAPGGLHMVVERGECNRKIIKLVDSPQINGVRPSADVLFASVAETYAGSNILAVVLTGMGHDAKAGIAQLKQNCNCYCLAQSEESCVVYGMPRSVYEAGLADEVVALPEMARRIYEVATRGCMHNGMLPENRG